MEKINEKIEDLLDNIDLYINEMQVENAYKEATKVFLSIEEIDDIKIKIKILCLYVKSYYLKFSTYKPLLDVAQNWYDLSFKSGTLNDFTGSLHTLIYAKQSNADYVGALEVVETIMLNKVFPREELKYQYHYLKGYLYWTAGLVEDKEAEKQFSLCLDIKRDNHREVHYQLGALYATLKDFFKSIHHFKKAYEEYDAIDTKNQIELEIIDVKIKLAIDNEEVSPEILLNELNSLSIKYTLNRKLSEAYSSLAKYFNKKYIYEQSFYCVEQSKRYLPKDIITKIRHIIIGEEMIANVIKRVYDKEHSQYIVSLFRQFSKEYMNFVVSTRKNEAYQAKSKYDFIAKEQEIVHLKALDDFKKRFFSNITHDIRTPMSLILAPLETVLSKNIEPEIEKNLKTVYSNALKLEELLDQLLDLNKIEEGILKPKYVFGNISHFCNKIVQHLDAENRIKYTVEPSLSNDSSYFSEDGMYKIFQNLISNALKFSEKEKDVEINLSKEKNNLILIVKDHGIGIAEKDLLKIFDRFYQVDYADTKLYQGTGIGLSIVKDYVELLKGTIHVSSTVGEGTTFKVILPYKDTLEKGEELIDVSKAKYIDKKTSAPEHGKIISSVQKEADEVKTLIDTILLIDDNEELRAFLHSQLSEEYHIMEASNGKEGIEKAEKYLPSIIISDIMMPEVDGITLCKTLKKHPETNHIPIILLTAKTSTDSELKGYEVDADAYIKKPFNLEILKATIHSIVQNRSLVRSAIMHSIQNNINEHPDFKEDDSFIEKFKKTIDANIFNKELNVNFIAKELNMSRNTLLRKVEHYTGTMPKEIIRDMKLNMAHKMLSDKTNSVKETAYTLGYQKLDTFHKAFKDRFGYTPGSIKKKN